MNLRSKLYLAQAAFVSEKKIRQTFHICCKTTVVFFLELPAFLDLFSSCKGTAHNVSFFFFLSHFGVTLFIAAVLVRQRWHFLKKSVCVRDTRTRVCASTSGHSLCAHACVVRTCVFVCVCVCLFWHVRACVHTRASVCFCVCVLGLLFATKETSGSKLSRL